VPAYLVADLVDLCADLNEILEDDPALNDAALRVLRLRHRSLARRIGNC